jgi:hypothetical protein
MAESSTGQAVKDLTTVYTSLLLDLPLASVRQGAGLAGEKETSEAVWKGYDAGVRLATAAIDTLYRSPLFGDAVSRTLNELLRWQRVTNAVSGTVLTGMWRALGVPTAVDVRGISDQLLPPILMRLCQRLQKLLRPCWCASMTMREPTCAALKLSG